MVDSTVKNAPHSSWCHVCRAIHLETVGRIREAIEVAHRAYEMDPLNLDVANLRGQSLYFGGRYAEARPSLENTLARWPESRATASNLIVVCVHTQDWAAVDSLLAPERLARFPLRGTKTAFVMHRSCEIPHRSRVADPSRRRRGGSRSPVTQTSPNLSSQPISATWRRLTDRCGGEVWSHWIDP